MSVRFDERTLRGQMDSMIVEDRVKPEGRPGDDIAMTASVAAMSVTTVFTILVVLTSGPMSLSWFAFHPPLQVLAIGLFSYGILTLQPTNQPKTKAAGLTRHQLYMFLIGTPSILAGTWVVYHNKNINGRAHFASWHGFFGILTILWLVGQIFVGAGSVWFGGALFGGGMQAKSLWKYHRASGYLLYPSFLFVLHLGGAWSSFSTGNSSHFMRFVAYSMAPIITLIGVYSRARLSKMKFF
ncbi:hypothetical protein SCHPADRAFT_856637 [Schizopora paradoxa]|uniref:Cytochrome b561 domain-containing protein n=1 Tax=Schizopora paradoxa TaxID=27342 RepID=A0A0H2RF07_9AGAM|nr:hypothetical protein SCHPADRAFT_856637 [Schizopora paradoxa]